MKCFLHIGTGKTGTSSIQNFLKNNKHVLKRLGYLYSKSSGPKRHYKLYWYTRDREKIINSPTWKRSDNKDFDNFCEEFEAELRVEVNSASESSMVLSDEGLWACQDCGIKRLHTLLTSIFKIVYVIVYLRRQDDHLISRYQQTIKTGEIHTFDEFCEKIKFTGNYNYYERLNAWSAYFGKMNLRLRKFEPNLFKGKHLCKDFLDAIEINKTSEFCGFDVKPINTSMDTKRTEFLRRVNEQFPVTNDQEQRKLRKQIINTLVNYSTGQFLPTEESKLTNFMALFEKSNSLIEKEYFISNNTTLFESDANYKDLPAYSEFTLEEYIKIAAEFSDIKLTKMGKVAGVQELD